MQPDADLSEERDRFLDGQSAEDAADDRSPSAVEVRVGDDGVRHVAASAAADENLGAGAAGAVEKNDRCTGMKASREDRGRQAGGAGADDGDLRLLGSAAAAGQVAQQVCS